MKTKNVILKFILSITMIGMIATGCKKNEEVATTTSDDELSQQMVNADDESRIADENDQMVDEINQVALTNSKFRGPHLHPILNGHVPCNTTVDSSLASQGRITITFNGNNCNGTRARSGSITLQLPYDATTNTVTPWSDAGCVLTVTFNAVTITRLSDNKSITYNGSRTITNVNGGLVDDAPDFITPIIHHITGMMQITFNNNTTRTWNIDRTRTINRANSITTITITGNATQGGYSNVSIWGINRHGNNFYINIPTPVVLSSACNFNAMSGVRIHHGVVRELTVTYGVDASGNPVTSGCPYGFKLNWIGRNGTAHQKVMSY